MLAFFGSFHFVTGSHFRSRLTRPKVGLACPVDERENKDGDKEAEDDGQLHHGSAGGEPPNHRNCEEESIGPASDPTQSRHGAAVLTMKEIEGSRLRHRQTRREEPDLGRCTYPGEPKGGGHVQNRQSDEKPGERCIDSVQVPHLSCHLWLPFRLT